MFLEKLGTKKPLVKVHEFNPRSDWMFHKLLLGVAGYMRGLDFMLYHLCGSGCNRTLAQ